MRWLTMRHDSTSRRGRTINACGILILIIAVAARSAGAWPAGAMPTPPNPRGGVKVVIVCDSEPWPSASDYGMPAPSCHRRSASWERGPVPSRAAAVAAVTLSVAGKPIESVRRCTAFAGIPRLLSRGSTRFRTLRSAPSSGHGRRSGAAAGRDHPRLARVNPSR